MSALEKNLLASGKNIRNHTDHGLCRGDEATTSHGFCFCVGDKQEAVLASRHLKGIVMMQWLMVAKVDENNTILKVGNGRYVTQFDAHGYPLSYGYFKELYTEEMNIYDFEAVHFYPVIGISVKASKTSGIFTAMVPPMMANKRERNAVRLVNKFAMENEEKYSHFTSVPELSYDFTREPNGKTED